MQIFSACNAHEKVVAAFTAVLSRSEEMQCKHTYVGLTFVGEQEGGRGISCHWDSRKKAEFLPELFDAHVDHIYSRDGQNIG